MLVTLVVAAQARTRPHYGGTLRVETQSDPWQEPGGAARRLVLDGLTHVDVAGNVLPALAINWKSEDGEHRWQFQMRPGVHFHDGSPLTAAAVAQSLEQACSRNCPWGAVKTVGSQLILTGEAPMPNLPALLAGDEFLIEHASANGGVDGAGPFQVAGFSGGLMTLTANDDYWAGRPFVDAVELHTRRAVHDQWIDLEAGRADIVEVPAEDLRQAKQQHMTTVESRPAELLALTLSSSGSLANPNLRRAIGMAVDRSAIYNVIYQKQGEVTASLLPGWMTGYAFLFPAGRDLDKAHELRGGANPPTLTFSTVGSGSAMELAAGRIALNLREAGFKVQTAANGTQAPDLVLRVISLEQAEAAPALESLARELSELQSDAAKADTEAHVLPSQPANTPEARYRAERDFLADATVVPLLYLPRSYAAGGRVRDLQLNADGSWNLCDVSLADAARPDGSRPRAAPGAPAAGPSNEVPH